jgi:hypothetical protein
MERQSPLQRGRRFQMIKDPVLVKSALNALTEARDALAATPTADLSFQKLTDWRAAYKDHMNRAENITGAIIAANVGGYTAGFEREKDVTVLEALRTRMLDNLNRNIGAMDATRVPVRPELEQLIGKVTHPKLSVMLKEFQEMQASQPNSAGIVLAPSSVSLSRSARKRHGPNSKCRKMTS